MAYNFKKCENCDNQNLPYDYKSIMHYHATAFSKNGQPTIQIKPNGGTKGIGQRDKFSKLDIEGINALYCNGKKPNPNPNPKPNPNPNPNPNTGCSDVKSECSFWYKNEQCTSNKYRSYMEKNCKKTCGKCPGQCADGNPNCSSWYQQGQCTNSKYSPFMLKNCKKSCGRCR